MKEIYSKKTVGEFAVDWKEINYNSLATEEVLREYARAFQSEVNKKAALIVLESLSEEKKLMSKKFEVRQDLLEEMARRKKL